MKRKLIIVGIVVLVAGIAFGIYGWNSNQRLQTIREMPIADVDLSSIDDGVYKGSYFYSNSGFEVDVTVMSHQIVMIESVPKKKTKYTEMASELIEPILEAQSLQVDVVTGATTSSKALLKAVENALLQQSQ